MYWTTKPTKYVDVDSGEELRKESLERYYQTIKTIKDVKINEIRTKGVIEHTVECRRKPEQGELFKE